ncbi:maleylpyruvate isomerase N-terminal domain-containing protein [Kocuria sp. LUK]|uniref:maleylpyruvate isomerase N-terminal domain-containing protein n=1 Tax=Kocuria sp. LUK TaxID=2897828 RepID=UPI001E4274AA|nr:maleylpyruvate isomerase N-terminal domain-containing protein [Kocuria sp. LUK]MCD1143728.1 maleylpyruvate isomerase N-terminal domain-containing protein [Kocuria sp. LUK]
MTRDPAAARAAFLEAGVFLARLADEVEELDEAAEDSLWERPALGSWDLRALLGHAGRALSTLTAYLDRPAAAEECTGTGHYYALAASADPQEVAARGTAAGRELGPEPAAAVRAALEAAREALARVPLEQDPLIRTPFGGARLSTYLPTRTFELAVHGLDVAAACGLDRTPPDHVLADTALTLAEIAAERGRVPELLQALTGRRALPPGWSLLG